MLCVTNVQQEFEEILTKKVKLPTNNEMMKSENKY